MTVRSFQWARRALALLTAFAVSCTPTKTSSFDDDASTDAGSDASVDAGVPPIGEPPIPDWDGGADDEDAGDTPFLRSPLNIKNKYVLTAVLSTVMFAGAISRMNVNEPPVLTPLVDVSGRALVDAALACSATDDGHKQALTYSWTQLTGATTCPLSSYSAQSPNANCKAAGTYAFRCSVYDGEFTVTDDLALTVTEPLVLDAVIAAGGQLPNSAPQYAYRYYSGYTGPPARVRRSSDNAQQDIAYTASGLIDTAAMASFCGANNCFLVTTYDGGGAGRDWTNATTTAQFKVYDSVTGFLKVGNLPVAQPTTSNLYTRSDVLGMTTGAGTAVSMWTGVQFSTLSADRVIAHIGAGGHCFAAGARSTGNLTQSTTCFGLGGGREVTPGSTLTTGFHSIQYGIPQGGPSSRIAIRHNGTLLPQAAISIQPYSNLAGATATLNEAAGGSRFAGSWAGTILWGGAAATAAQTVPVQQALTGFGEQLRVLASSPSTITYPVQAAAAQGAPTPSACYSCGELVDSTYTGPILTIAVGSEGGTQYNIGATTLGRLNLVALASFCTGQNCYAMRVHDQCGADRDVTPIGTAYKLWDASTGFLGLRDLAVCRAPSSGAAGYGRPDSLGLSGNPAVTVYWSGRDSATGTTRTHWSLGDGAGSLSVRGFSNDDIGAAIGDATSYQRFNNTPPQHATHWLFSSGAAADVGDMVLEHGLVTVAEATSSGPTDNPNISGTSFVWGGRTGSTAQPGDLSTLIVWPADLTSLQRAPVRTFGQRQKIDFSAVTALVAGQSNASNLNQNNTPYVRNWNLPWTWVAVANTGLALWEPPSDTLYVQLRDAIIAADPRYPVIIWWIQGEADCSVGPSAIYASKFLTMWTALKADTGRPDLFLLDTLLDTAGNCVELATINVEKNTVHTTLGNRYSALLDPHTQAGGILDEAIDWHWDPTKQAAMYLYSRDTALLSYPSPN